VAIKLVQDLEVAGVVDPVNVTVNEEVTTRLFDQASQAALSTGRKLIQQVGGEMVVLAIAGEADQAKLQELFQVGADRVIRIWDVPVVTTDIFGKGLLLARACTFLEPDVVLFGSCSHDTGQGALGAITGEMLGYAVACGLTQLEIDEERNKLVVQRKLSKGAREELEVALPAVLTVEPELANWIDVSLAQSLEALTRQVELMELAELGVDHHEIAVWHNRVQVISINPPRPYPADIFTPDSSLAPLERIQEIVSGGMDEKNGVMLEGEPEEMAEQIFQILLKGDYIS
jgi:electron transfer flavoprotein alpha/beta subunit